MRRWRARAAVGVGACVVVVAWITLLAAQRGADGAGEISGVVVTTSVPATPLARVLVTISGQSLAPSRTLITDDQGRFVFRNLPAGSFIIEAVRPPYVKTAFGAKRAGRPGTPVDLSNGQHVAGVTIPLARGAAITGVIRNTSGAPAPGIKVEAVPLRPDTPATPIGAIAMTDDRGVYRVFGLPPGGYVIRAAVTDNGSAMLTQFSDADLDEIIGALERRSTGLAPARGIVPGTGAASVGPLRPNASTRPATYGYAPVYYPGTADPDQAVTLAIDEGQERAGIDVDLHLVRTAAIEGRVSIAGGTLPSGTEVTLTRQRSLHGAANALTTSATTRQSDATGAFHFVGTLPGKYQLVARAAMSAYWALSDVTIDGDDVSGLSLTLEPGLRVSGRLAFDRHTEAPPRDLAAIRLRLADVNGPSNVVPASGAGRADGTFEIDGVIPGTYGIVPLLPDATWRLRSAVVNGRDMLDVPLEIASGDVTGVVVTFTDQHTELSGTLQSAVNIPAPDYFVVVFPSDRAFWRPGSRRVQVTRPTTDGRFTLRDLPAGDYLMAALTDMEASDLGDETFLERLVPAALPVHINESGKTTQDVRLAR